MAHIVEIQTRGTTVPLTDVRYLPVGTVAVLASLPDRNTSEQLAIVMNVVQEALARPTDWDAHLAKLPLEEFTAFVSSWFSTRHAATDDLDAMIADMEEDE